MRCSALIRRLKSPSLLLLLMVVALLSFIIRIVNNHVLHASNAVEQTDGKNLAIRTNKAMLKLTSTNKGAPKGRPQDIMKSTSPIHEASIPSQTVLDITEKIPTKQNKEVCAILQKSFEVLSGKSWGSMTKVEDQDQWRFLQCDDLLQEQKDLSLSSSFTISKDLLSTNQQKHAISSLRTMQKDAALKVDHSKPVVFERTLPKAFPLPLFLRMDQNKTAVTKLPGESFEIDLQLSPSSAGSLQRFDKSKSPFRICSKLVSRYGVRPEVSWGNMNLAADRNYWQALECNTVLKKKGDIICSELHGSQFLNKWRKNRVDICSDGQHYCQISIRDNIQCSFAELKLDFRNFAPYRFDLLTKLFRDYNKDHGGEMTTLSDPYDPLQRTKVFASAEVAMERSYRLQTKTFDHEFGAAYCPHKLIDEGITNKLNDYFPNFEFNSSMRDEMTSNNSNCDVFVDEPVLLVSHDCMNNLGHLMQDILNWWIVGELHNVPLKSLTLVNIDGLRPGNVLSGPGRWILDPLDPDGFGPFRQIFDILFGRIVSATSTWGPKTHVDGRQERGQIVCFRNKVFAYPMPLKGFLWDKFEVEDPCSHKLQPSYIYRKFVSEYMNYWHTYGSFRKHQESFPSMVKAYPSTERVFRDTTPRDIRLLLITRKLSTSSATREILGRAYGNLPEVISSLEAMMAMDSSRSMTLIVADFAELPFAEQVALANSVDVLVGFHGAGINHMFHMNYTRPRCCGVVEIFPQSEGCEKIDKQLCVYHRRIGHGNHCRFLGYKYATVQSPKKSFNGVSGTIVDTAALSLAIQEVLSLISV